MKYFTNQAKSEPIYYWRDVQGHEIDFLIERSYCDVIPIEVKARKTVSDDFFKEIVVWKNISKQEEQHAFIVYFGDMTATRKLGTIVAWHEINKIF